MDKKERRQGSSAVWADSLMAIIVSQISGLDWQPILPGIVLNALTHKPFSMNEGAGGKI
jgi:hypothetical protein